MKRSLLPFLIIIPGVAGMSVFGYYALQDWGQLQQDYVAYQALAATSSDLAALFKAHAAQNIQRINLFADGTWFLLTAIFTAIGIVAWRQ
jgi:hypothetical protein